MTRRIYAGAVRGLFSGVLIAGALAGAVHAISCSWHSDCGVDYRAMYETELSEHSKCAARSYRCAREQLDQAMRSAEQSLGLTVDAQGAAAPLYRDPVKP